MGIARIVIVPRLAIQRAVQNGQHVLDLFVEFVTTNEQILKGMTRGTIGAVAIGRVRFQLGHGRLLLHCTNTIAKFGSTIAIPADPGHF